MGVPLENENGPVTVRSPSLIDKPPKIDIGFYVHIFGLKRLFELDYH